jgi:hypothetical protein
MAAQDDDILTPQTLFLQLKSVLKGRFTSTEKVNAEATRALMEALEKGFPECFQKLHEHCPRELF